MTTLLTLDGIEDVDYCPSDSELRGISASDSGLLGIDIGVLWIRAAAGGFWSIIAGRRVDVVPAAIGWCYTVDGRGYWCSELARVPSEVCALYGCEVVADGDE